MLELITHFNNIPSGLMEPMKSLEQVIIENHNMLHIQLVRASWKSSFLPQSHTQRYYEVGQTSPKNLWLSTLKSNIPLTT